MNNKPLIKWSGGKTKELSIIKLWMPSIFNLYYEPFVGGGACWLDLNHPKNVVSDTYIELIDFYQIIKKYKTDVINYINNVVSKYNSIDKTVLSKTEFNEVAEKYYYYYRNNMFDNEYDRALQFYMIRQLSFSGMLRFSKSGKYNVPFGWYKTVKKIKASSSLFNLLDSTDIKCSDWSNTVSTASKDDFVFLDPPYTRKFQVYSPYNVFGHDEHLKLAEWFKTSQSKNLIILNKDEFTHNLYSDYIVTEYDYKYSIQYRNRMTEADSNTIHFIAINNYSKANSFF